MSPRQVLRRTVDQPAIPPMPQLASIEEDDQMEEIVETEPSVAEFVRVISNQVGPYPQNSVLPASHFEQLERLLGLGAVAYDFDATATSIINPGDGGNATTATLTQPARAAWMAGTPEEVLGHMAMLKGQESPGQVYLADQPARQVPNTILNPPPALNDASHAVTSDIQITPNG